MPEMESMTAIAAGCVVRVKLMIKPAPIVQMMNPLQITMPYRLYREMKIPLRVLTIDCGTLMATRKPAEITASQPRTFWR